MRNFTEKDIKHEAYRIYKVKLQAGIPDGSPKNNERVNWEEAKENLSIIDDAHRG